MNKEKLIKKLMKLGFNEEKANEYANELEKEDEEGVSETKEEIETTKVEEPKETEKVVEEIKEEPKEEVKLEEPKKETNYDALIQELREEISGLKETLSSQSAKTDKAYEILAAQGEKVEEDEFAYTPKFLGSNEILPRYEGKEQSQNEFAKKLNGGYDVR